MKLQTRKGVPVLNFLIGFVVSLLIVGVVVAMTVLIMSQMGSTLADGGHGNASLAANETRDAIATVSGWLDIIVLIGVVVVILGLIGYLGWTKMSAGN